jgi:putative Holliday junction resolvase
MRVLGIDFGERRIGLALSDASGTLARPWRTLEGAKDPARIVKELTGVVAELQSDPDGLRAVVLGYPRRLDGSATAVTATVETLAAALRRSLTVPVVLQDERLSSREAESRLALRERDWRKRKPLVDAAAAAVVLQDYLDAQGGLRAVSGLDTESDLS